MSIYTEGVEAQRETVKWLVALVPTAAIVAVAGTLLVEVRHRGAEPFTTWLGDVQGPLLALVVALAGTAGIVGAGARVLSAQPKDLTATIGDPKQLTHAFAAGVGAPHFTSGTEFADAMRALAAAWASGTVPDEQHVARAEAATESLRAWVLHDEVVRRFRRFVVCFGVGVAAILGGLAVAQATWPPPAARFTEPTEVVFTVADEAAFQEATDCAGSEETAAIAVGGTWEDPVLELHGPGCPFDARWSPDPEEVQLRPVGG